MSLGPSVLACQLADLLWPVFLVLGLERVEIQPGLTAVTPLAFTHYPWSHSLVMLQLWALAFGVISFAAWRKKAAAVLGALLVLSHWFLDAVVHLPDLPLWPGGPLYGLGFWNSRLATVAIEAPLFGLGLRLYLRRTVPRDRLGRWGLATWLVVVVMAYAMNLQAIPPPNVSALMWTALVSMVLLVAWAWWADAHRMMRHDSPQRPNPRTTTI